MKRKITILLLLVLAAVGVIVMLEILSRKCPDLIRKEYPNCSYLIEKYVRQKEKDEVIIYNILPEEIDKEDLDRAIEERVFEVEAEDINMFNGIACGNYGFVSEELPYFSKKYVKIHEALHLLGYSNETKINYMAGLRHPLGLVQTVFYTFFSGFQGQKIENYPCILGNLWGSFKKYFLEFEEKRIVPISIIQR